LERTSLSNRKVGEATLFQSTLVIGSRSHFGQVDAIIVNGLHFFGVDIFDIYQVLRGWLDGFTICYNSDGKKVRWL
jgi:hypothetical protein